MGKGGAMNLNVGGQCIGSWGINTVKTLTFKKGGGPHLQWWRLPRPGYGLPGPREGSKNFVRLPQFSLAPSSE